MSDLFPDQPDHVSLDRQIEAGDFGDVLEAAVVLNGTTIEVFGMGANLDGATAHLLLSAGALKLAKATLREAEG